jgi:hypothetical protein
MPKGLKIAPKYVFFSKEKRSNAFFYFYGPQQPAGAGCCATFQGSLFAHSLTSFTELLRNSLRPLARAWYGG